MFQRSISRPQEWYTNFLFVLLFKPFEPHDLWRQGVQSCTMPSILFLFIVPQTWKTKLKTSKKFDFMWASSRHDFCHFHSHRCTFSPGSHFSFFTRCFLSHEACSPLPRPQISQASKGFSNTAFCWVQVHGFVSAQLQNFRKDEAERWGDFFTTYTKIKYGMWTSLSFLVGWAHFTAQCDSQLALTAKSRLSNVSEILWASQGGSI